MFSIVIYSSKPSKTPYLSILNFNLKINFSKFSSKEVKFYVFMKLFSENVSCARVTPIRFSYIFIIVFSSNSIKKFNSKSLTISLSCSE